MENAESSSGLAVGNFTRDQIPDFFAVLSKGTWPNSTIGIQVMLDGRNGDILFTDSLGCVGFWSPVAYDLNRDGIDEGIISYSEFNCYRDSTDRRPLDVVNKLVAIDFDRGVNYTIDSTRNFKNVLATPWAGDLDGDSYLDLVYSQCFNANYDILSFLGMNVKRISTAVKMRKPMRWGGYMGSNGDGIYPLSNDE